MYVCMGSIFYIVLLGNLYISPCRTMLRKKMSNCRHFLHQSRDKLHDSLRHGMELLLTYDQYIHVCGCPSCMQYTYRYADVCVCPEVPASSPPDGDAALVTPPTKRRLVSPSTKGSMPSKSTEENCGVIMGGPLHDYHCFFFRKKNFWPGGFFWG